MRGEVLGLKKFASKVFACLLACGAFQSASANVLTVRNLNRSHTEVLVEIVDPRGFNVGDAVVIDQECSLRILKLPHLLSKPDTTAAKKPGARRFVAATNLCENLSLLRIGRSFTVTAPRPAANLPGSLAPVGSPAGPLEQGALPLTAAKIPEVTSAAEGLHPALPVIEQGLYLENGFQVAVVKEFFTVHSVRSDSVQSDTASGDVAQTLGLQIGYAYVPVEKPGFNLHSGINFYEYETKSVPLGVLLTYAYNPYFALELGPKMEYFFGSGLVNDEIGFGYGGEAGFLVQATPNFGFELKYGLTHHDHVTFTNHVTTDFMGLSLGLTATF